VLDRKLHRGITGDEHRHVYGANLAVSADAGRPPTRLPGLESQDSQDAANVRI
jgi:hypothetical protein